MGDVDRRVQPLLVTLAMINVNWDVSGATLLDAFVPFVVDVARRDAPVVAGDVASALEVKYGLHIPIPVVEMLIRRAAERSAGLVRREALIVRDEAVGAELDARRAAARRDYNACVGAFASYIGSHLPNLQTTVGDPGAALRHYVEDNALSLLRRVTRGTSEPLPADDAASFAVAAFVDHVAANDPQVFSYLETVIKGSMLASAMYLPEALKPQAKFGVLRVVIDTPLLIRALGLQSPAQEAAAVELLSLLRTLGARLTCFPHIIQETRGVLDSAVRNLRSPRARQEQRSAVVEHCLEVGISPSELETRAAGLERSLAALAVEIEDAPVFTERTTIDEDALESLLQAEVGYFRADARINDLRSITAVHQLRGGRVQRDFDNARAILVTTNSGVVRAARKFFDEWASGVTPHCIRDFELATIAWLRSPLKAPSLPREQLLADCYASQIPNDALWRSYVDEVDALMKQDKLDDHDYVLLKFSVDARRALMRRTGGDPDAVVVGTVHEVLREARLQLAADERRKLEALAEQLQKEQLAREEERGRVASGEMLRAAHVRRAADAIAHRIALIVCVILGIFAATGAILAFPAARDALPVEPPTVVRYILVGIAGVAAALGLLDLILGISVRDLYSRIERWMSGYVVRVIGRVSEPPETRDVDAATPRGS